MAIQRWNPSKTNFWNALTNSDLTVTKSAGNHGTHTGTQAETLVTFGKKYWEIALTTFGSVSGSYFGFGNSSMSIADGDSLGIDVNSIAWWRYDADISVGGTIYNNVSTGDVPGYTQGNRLCFALDKDNNKWWCRVNNGAWNSVIGGTQNPATNQGGFTLPAALASAGIAPAVTLHTDGDSIDAKFAPASWLYAAPSGFGSFDQTTQNATVSIAGSATLVAQTSIPIGTLSGTGTLAAIARVRAAGLAILSGVNTFVGRATGPYKVTLALAGSGTLTASPTVRGNARATLASSVNLGVFFAPSIEPERDITPAPIVDTPIDDYLNLVPNYNAVQPKFMAMLRNTLQSFVDQQAMFAGMPSAFDLDFAIGTQLDQVGIWIGRDRNIATPLEGVYFSWDTDGLGWEEGTWQGAFDPNDGTTRLDDVTYRQLLYAKVAANNWDSSPSGIVAILQNLSSLEGTTIQVIDNDDMTMTVNITGTLTSLVFRALLENGYIPIKPAGVGVTYVLP